MTRRSSRLFFFFKDPATPEIYPLSLHDALPIFDHRGQQVMSRRDRVHVAGQVQVERLHGDDLAVSAPGRAALDAERGPHRSEEHTSELQSQSNLVCRLLLEKKKSNDCRVTVLY